MGIRQEGKFKVMKILEVKGKEVQCVRQAAPNMWYSEHKATKLWKRIVSQSSYSM